MVLFDTILFAVMLPLLVAEVSVPNDVMLGCVAVVRVPPSRVAVRFTAETFVVTEMLPKDPFPVTVSVPTLPSCVILLCITDDKSVPVSTWTPLT